MIHPLILHGPLSPGEIAFWHGWMILAATAMIGIVTFIAINVARGS